MRSSSRCRCLADAPEHLPTEVKGYPLLKEIGLQALSALC